MPLYFVFILLLSFVPRPQSPGPSGIRGEEELILALLKVRQDRSATLPLLLKEHRDLVTPRLWENLSRRAASAYFSGPPENSLSIYEAAVEVAKHLQDRRLEATTYYDMGRTYSSLGKAEEAIRVYLSSLERFEEAGLWRDVIYVLSDLADRYFSSQDYGPARVHAERSVALAEKMKGGTAPAGAWPDGYGLAGALSVLGALSQLEGYYSQAIDFFRRSLALYEGLDGGSSLKFASHVADKYSALGAIYNVIGDNRQALLLLNRALDISQRLANRAPLASVLNNLGMLYLDQEDYIKAADCFNRSLEIYRARDDRSELSRVLLNLGVVHQRQAEFERALERFRASEQYATAVSNKEVMIATREGIGAVYHLTGRNDEAAAVLDRGLELAREIGDQTRIAEISWRKAEVEMSKRNYREAAALSEGALDLALRLQLPNLSYYAATVLGRALRGQGRKDLALQTYARAIERLEEMRLQIVGREHERQGFLENKVEAYHSLIGLLVEQGKAGDALLYAERAKGRVLLDAVGGDRVDIAASMTPEEKEKERQLNREIVDLNGQMRDARLRQPPDGRLGDLSARLESARVRYSSYLALLSASRPGAGSRRGSVPSLATETLARLTRDRQTAFIEYVVTKESLLVFVLTGNDPGGRPNLKVYPIDIGQKDLTAKVDRFRKALALRRPAFSDQARELYDLLVRPAEPQLAGVKTLCLIPDGALWDLPFQATQSRTDRFLIEDHALYYAPSLSVLDGMRARGAARAGRPPAALLAFGNPTAGGKTVALLHEAGGGEGFGPLPEAEAEVRALEDIVGPRRSRTFVGMEATEQAFKSLAPGADFIHFATHGVLDNRHPLYSYLLLSKGEGLSDDDGLVEAREIMNLDLSADVVVLSACETARGRIGAGEGVVGVSWAFFVSGCSTTVVSQWKVDSASTSLLMPDFYRRLGAGGAGPKASKADAFRHAAIETLKTPRYRHPYYWAGFIVIGNAD